MYSTNVLDNGIHVTCANGFQVTLLVDATKRLNVKIIHPDPLLIRTAINKIPQFILDKIVVNPSDYHDFVEYISDPPASRLYVQ